MTITEILTSFLTGLDNNFYIDRESRAAYATNEVLFLLDKLGNSDDRFTAEECALFHQAAEALAKAGDAPKHE